MTILSQTSFGKGEIDPRLQIRVDTQLYQVAVNRALNMITHVAGGMSNRNGYEFVGPCPRPNLECRLVEFRFKSTDRYMLEISEGLIRFIRNEGYVLGTPRTIESITLENPGSFHIPANGFAIGSQLYVSDIPTTTTLSRLNGRTLLVTGAASADDVYLGNAGTGQNIDTSQDTPYPAPGTVTPIYFINTPYLDADIMKLKFTQQGDVMKITHPNYPELELRRMGTANWTLVPPIYQTRAVHPVGLALAAQGVTGDHSITYKVTNLDPSTGDESGPSFAGTVYNITAVSLSNPCQITAPGANANFDAGQEIGVDLIVGTTELNGGQYIIEGISDDDIIQLQGVDATHFTPYVSGGITARTELTIPNSATNEDADHLTDNTIEWLNPDSPFSGVKQIYRADNGIYGLIGISSTQSFQDNKNVLPDTSQGPPTSRNPFLGTGNYPGCSTYFEQRFVAAGSANKPDTLELSRVGRYNSFATSSPIKEDDAIEVTLASGQVEEIRFLVSGQDLLAFTSGAEWRIASGTDSGLSASTIRAKLQSRYGSSDITPALVSGEVVFFPDDHVSMRAFRYEFAQDSYQSSDLLEFARHLLEPPYTIVDAAYCESPEPTIFVVRSDGTLLACVYKKEQQVLAWTHLETQGAVTRVGVTRFPNDPDPQVYLCVRRQISGVPVRYIEKLKARRRIDDVRFARFSDSHVHYEQPKPITGVIHAAAGIIQCPAHGFSTGDEIDVGGIQWQPLVDELGNETYPPQLNGGRVYVGNNVGVNSFGIIDSNGDPIDTSGYTPYQTGGACYKAFANFTGLDHLEGNEVVVLANGDVITGCHVVSGALDPPLERKASIVTVGLPFTAELETLDLEPGQQNLQAVKGRTYGVTVHMELTGSFLVGDPTNPRGIYRPPTRYVERIGEPNALFTGRRYFPINSDYTTSGSRLLFRMKDPLPMTILGVNLNRDVSDAEG